MNEGAVGLAAGGEVVAPLQLHKVSASPKKKIAAANCFPCLVCIGKSKLVLSNFFELAKNQLADGTNNKQDVAFQCRRETLPKHLFHGLGLV